ncbi:MAG: hypothetical protein PHG48_06130 [Eubacteriales bacterium]|nr:hypothetical protein [Eubacteriales bacterium]
MTNMDSVDISRDLKDLKAPMWLSTHVTDVYVASPDAPYWTGTGGDVIYGDCRGDVFVSMAVEGVIPFKETDGQHHPGKYDFKRGIEAWKRDGSRLWYLADHKGNSMCYSPVKDTILTFETAPSRIEELEAATGKILRKIDRTELGDIGGGIDFCYGGSRLCYDAQDHDKFWYADTEHHIVALTDFSGHIYMQIGEYDKPGDDREHLRNPKTVSNTNTWGRVLIGDTGNHRVIEYGPAFRYKESFPFPDAYASFIVGNQVAIYNGGNPYNYYGLFMFSDHLTCRPYSYLPFNTDSFVVHPQDPSRAVIRWDDGVSREISIGGLNGSISMAYARLFPQIRAAGLSEIASPPIVDFYRPNKSIVLKSTKPGKVFYEVANFTARDAKWNGEWTVVEEFAIAGGKALRINDMSPVGACRLRLIPEADCTIEGWVNLCS